MRTPKRWKVDLDNSIEDSSPKVADLFRYELTTTVEYREAVTFEQWLENHADCPC